MHYTFETYQDHIPTSFLGTYTKDRKQIEEFLEYPFYWDTNEGTQGDAPAQGLNWLVIGLAVFFTAVFSLQALRFSRVSVMPVSTTLYAPGISGWLVFLALGVFTNPLRIFSSLIKSPVFTNSVWLQLDKATNVTHNVTVLQLLLVVEIAGIIALLVYSLLLVSLFHKKRDTFPKAMIIFFAASLAFTVADNLACYYIFEKTSLEEDAVRDLVVAVIAAVLWIPYLIRSEQVKETFIMPHEKDIPDRY
jgi:uncharacterized membrane protein